MKNIFIFIFMLITLIFINTEMVSIFIDSLLPLKFAIFILIILILSSAIIGLFNKSIESFSISILISSSVWAIVLFFYIMSGDELNTNSLGILLIFKMIVISYILFIFNKILFAFLNKNIEKNISQRKYL